MSDIGRAPPGWLRELCKLCRLWMLRWSSISSRVLLNAFTTRSCTVWQAAHPPVLHVLREGENGERRKNNAREREREGGQERKSERRKKKRHQKIKTRCTSHNGRIYWSHVPSFFFFFPLRMTKEPSHFFQLPLILEIKGLFGEAIKTATAPKQEQSVFGSNTVKQVDVFSCNR